MVHFFGILSPQFGKRATSREAPNKTAFFGGVTADAHGEVPLPRAEHEACYLAGKAPEPEPAEPIAKRPLVASSQHY